MIDSMLKRIRKIVARLRVDPAKTSLGWWMVAIHVAIVLLVGGGISYSAIRMLHDLGDDQGKTRVQLAGAMAREDLRRSAEDALTSARALAERPTLVRLLAEGRTDAIAPLLRRLCDTAGVDACAVFTGTQLIAQSGPELDWNDITTSSAEQGSSFLALPANVRMPVMGAYANVGTGEGTRLFVARLFNERLEKMLSQRVGLEIKLIDYRAFTNDPVNAFTPLYSASLADGRSAVQRINTKDLYAASVPVFASTGEAIALLQANLPTNAIDTSAGRLVQKLLLTAAILAALAVFGGLLLTEIVAGPVKAGSRCGIGTEQGVL